MPIRVEVFSSPGCSRCGQVFDLLHTITQELGAERIEWREVNVLDELDYAVELGVLSMPDQPKVSDRTIAKLVFFWQVFKLGDKLDLVWQAKVCAQQGSRDFRFTVLSVRFDKAQP